MSKQDKNLLRVTSIYSNLDTEPLELPLVYPKISAGFPSPAENYFEERLDLNKTLIKHPAATFYVKVEGNSMVDAGIFSGDILVVDRSLQPQNNSIVIAVLDGEFTVKKLRKEDNKLYMLPENPDFAPIEINEETDFLIWGVATYNIHKL
ncbi:MAG: translesion error-prone DNA polymerase V autoproteolytic subunit [Deltaproteobacteria bacterium]|nr:translesion error-prone DNA polymerase V autoproteolytic subunit [Deltaproteobacteria bacterium]MBW2601578.1 translesion error-prone DNA polymerase V autoproteolytic subunit [Deltaproteobacteria bacterium]